MESLGFVLDSASELILALGNECEPEEADEIQRLFECCLPPVTSVNALAVMFAYNPGFIWSLVYRTPKHYRHFEIPKGRGVRQISAPRVALKGVQKWLSFHFQKSWQPIENVFGFVPGRSHIQAASKHLSAEWVYSLDIEDFFPSIPIVRVRDALQVIGYQKDEGISIISSICCLRNNLVQGSPASPVISNIVLSEVDQKLASIAAENGLTFTRCADDIVFSGRGPVPTDTLGKVKATITDDGWSISNRKEHLTSSPNRLKVHGLLVHGEKLRLTKGYRNRIRAYRHMLDSGKVQESDLSKIRGHLNFSAQVDDNA